MKRNSIFKRIVSFSLVFVLLVSIFSIVNFGGNKANKAGAQTYTVPSSGTYQMADNVGYYPSKAQANSMSFGASSIGSLSVAGVRDQGNYGGAKAYSSDPSEQISFTYTLNYNKSGINSSVWNLSSDSATSVNGISLNGSSIGKGAVIVQKRNLSESNWTTLIRSGNVFNSNSSFDYTSVNGEDINQGCYYNISVAYEIYREWWVTRGWWIFKRKERKTEYKNCLETYQIFIGRNTCDIQLLDLVGKDYSSYSNEESQIDLIKKGDNLQDGSVTTQGFQMNYLGNKSYTVEVKKDGNKIENICDGMKFTDDGKYEVSVKSLFGNEVKRSVYVFKGGEYDKGFATYFGNSIFEGQRIADLSQALPTYQVGVKLRLNGAGAYVPALRGTIKNNSTGFVTTVDPSESAQTFTLNQEGVYMVSLVNGDEKLAGTTYHYDFAFIVSNESSAPSINLTNITGNLVMSDYETKHLEVAYTMPSGKIAHICFDKDSKYLAYQFAFELEKKYVSGSKGAYVYNGVTYTTDIALTNAMNEVVKTKVTEQYFIKGLTDFYVNEEMLSSTIKVEKLNFERDVYMTTALELGKMLAQNDIIDGNFKFVRVGDYESKTIVARNVATGEIINLDYNTKLSKMLSKSGRYEITETNAYNESVTYTICYANTNETVVSLDVDGTVVDVNNSNYQIINGTNVKFNAIANELDSDGVVAIFNLTTKTLELKNYEDAKNLTLSGANYLVSMIDRSGNIFSFVVNTLSEKETSVSSALAKVMDVNAKLTALISGKGVSSSANTFNG